MTYGARTSSNSLATEDTARVIAAQMPDLTAFGEVPIGEFQPECGWRFPGLIHPLLYNTTETNGTVTEADNQGTLTTTADPTATVVLQTKRKLRYIPGIGGLCRFTALWPSGGSAGSRQLVGIGDENDGLFIGYNGTTLSVSRRYEGTDNWIAQDAWDDPLDGSGASGMTLDPTKGNVFQIRYQWLGYGELRFFVEDPDVGGFIQFHRIQYANANTVPSLNDPTLPVRAEIVKTASTDVLVVKSPSAIAGTEGIPDGALVLPFAYKGTFAYSAQPAETPVIAFRVKSAFPAGTDNRVRVFPGQVKAAVEGNKPVTVAIYGNPTINAAGAWSDVIAGQSVLEVNTTATYTSFGVLLDVIELGKSDKGSADFFLRRLQQLAGDTSLITVQSVGATELRYGVSWDEEH